MTQNRTTTSVFTTISEYHINREYRPLFFDMFLLFLVFILKMDEQQISDLSDFKDNVLTCSDIVFSHDFTDFHTILLKNYRCYCVFLHLRNGCK